jgi:hypothetical protein
MSPVDVVMRDRSFVAKPQHERACVLCGSNSPLSPAATADPRTSACAASRTCRLTIQVLGALRRVWTTSLN